MQTQTKLCACGCGTVIQARNRNGELFYSVGHHWRGRRRLGEKRNQYGENNNNWKGGRIIDGEGYMQIRCEGHPRAIGKGHYVPEQILLIEKQIERYLTEDEIVHHINGNKKDNRIENLKLMKAGEHSSFHRKLEYAEGKKFGRNRN